MCSLQTLLLYNKKKEKSNFAWLNVQKQMDYKVDYRWLLL